MTWNVFIEENWWLLTVKNMKMVSNQLQINNISRILSLSLEFEIEIELNSSIDVE
jgi:hypothetical protein